MKRMRWLLLGALILMATAVPAPAVANPIVIDFEDLSTGGPGGAGNLVTVTSQYADRGITFNSPVALDYSKGPLAIPGFAHSGTKGIETCYSQEFCSAPITMTFTRPQARIKVWVGYESPIEQRTVVLRALAADGAEVGRATAVINPNTVQQPIRIPLEVITSSPMIVQARVSFLPETLETNGLAVDDVEFDTVGPPPPCQTTQAPVVTLDQPTAGLVVQRNEFMLQGAINSDSSLDVADLVINGSGGTRTINLMPHLLNSNGTFGPVRIEDSLFPGANTITVRAANCRDSGESSTMVTFQPIASNARFVFMGLEVTQAIQDLNNNVPLIAGKRTIVRVYLHMDGATPEIRNVAGALSARRSDGSSPTGPENLQSLNTITVDSSGDLTTKRRDINASLNFELPPEWLTEGNLHIQISHLDIEEAQSTLPCDGCDNVNQFGFPTYYGFQHARPLQLILAPYEYRPTANPPLTPEVFLTPALVLQWVNNVFPVPGNFPQTGDGINLVRILPVRTTSRNLQTRDGESKFINDLQEVLSSLQEQGGGSVPPDVRLFGMVPCGCGGMAKQPGQVAFGDTWAEQNGAMRPRQAEVYGQIWAQEIAHTFGRQHAGNWHGEAGGGGFDANFPYVHGGIGEFGVATNTEWWHGSPFIVPPGVADETGLARHAHDFMSYGASTAENTYSWVSPYTYSGLFNDLNPNAPLGASQIGPHVASPTEKLVVIGQVNADGSVDLRPFYRVTTDFVSSPGTSGALSLELIGASGVVLYTHRFDAQSIADESTTISFAETLPWVEGTARIVLKRNDTPLAERVVSPHPPNVRVLTPNGGETVGDRTTISWEANDPDGDLLHYTVLYNTGTDATWWPIATNVTSKAITIDTSLLPGSAQGRFRVRATDGVNTAEDDSDGGFTVLQKHPMVGIAHPTSGQLILLGTQVHLTGGAYDPEDGLLPAEHLTWTSNRDGLIGHGYQVDAVLSPGTHVIELAATDSQGQTKTAQVTVSVVRERFLPLILKAR